MRILTAMIHANVILLTREDCEAWRPFGDGDLALKFEEAWNIFIPGSPILAEFSRELDIGKLRCHYPSSRPVHEELFEHFYGCIFDADTCKDCGGCLKSELHTIPSGVIICFISEENRTYENKDNYFCQTITADNMEYMIPTYLGAVALLLFSKLDSKFESEAKRKLQQILRKYRKKIASGKINI